MSGLRKAVEALRAATAMPYETWARRVLPPAGEEALPLAVTPAPDDEAVRCPPGGSSFLPLLGEPAWDLPDNWNADPVSGFDFGRGPSSRVRARPEIPDADLLRCWVRGRGIELLHAARCGAAGDEAAAVFAELWLESFVETCPPGQGPHWASAMEVALRAVRLLQAADLVVHAGVSARRRSLFERTLLDHEQWLRTHSDWRAWRTGNHYLVATAGRFLLAACLKESPRRLREARRAWTLFWREFRRQVGFDGLHFESSTHYHLLVVETALHVFEVGERLDLSLPGKSRERLDLAVDAVAFLARPDGSIAGVGDSDDGCFSEGPNGRAPGALDDAWPLMRRAARLLGRPVGPLMRPACFEAAGLAVLALDEDTAVHVTVSFTGSGRGGTGGHGHDDCGSYETWCGLPVVVDRGTGNYTGDPGQRELFRSTRSHSVIEIDARTQNPPVEARPFRRHERAKPFLVEWKPAGAGAIEIGHHAWCGLPGAVAVLRRLELGADGVLAVRDELTGSGDHRLALRIQWAPGLEPSRSCVTPNGVSVPVWKGWREVAVLRVAAEGFEEMDLVSEDVGHSPRQGRVIPAKTTVIQAETALPARLEHSVAPPDDAPAA
jgi:hypothetical protein